MQRAQPQSSSRRGVVLVFFALLFVGFMAIAAMAVDLGLARLTQRQMNGATDTVALETLRERDRARSEAAETDPFLRDLMRRSLNARLATWRYTPDLSLGGDGEEEFDGAGGYILLSEGQGELNWGRVIEEIGWTAPRPRTNYESEEDEAGNFLSAIPRNLRHGDMVSGTFLPVQAGEGGNPFDMEDSTYDRPDFVTSVAENAPYGDSVLVRLRRTSHPYEGGGEGLDSQESVSSSGPTLPMLFSAGTGIQGGDSETNDSIRHTGFRIRATSIATARRAVRAGVRVPEEVLQGMIDEGQINTREAALLRVGVTGIALDRRIWSWQDQAGSPFQMWTPIGNGEDELILEIGTESESTQGLLFPNDPSSIAPYAEWVFGNLQEKEPRNVADRMPYLRPAAELDPSMLEPEHWLTEEGFVPIYSMRFSSPLEVRIVGFGRVRTELAIDPDTGQPRTNSEGVPLIRLIRIANHMALAPADPWIAPRNASAVFDGTQTDDLSDAEWETYLQQWRTLPRAVRAPALAR